MLAMPYAFNKYLLVLNVGKNIRPAHRSKADEINPFWIMKLVFGTHRISERSKLEDQLQTDCVMFRTSEATLNTCAGVGISRLSEVAVLVLHHQPFCISVSVLICNSYHVNTINPTAHVQSIRHCEGGTTEAISSKHINYRNTLNIDH